MKTIKFRRELADMIISGRKTKTWRLFDDKDLCAGEEVSFVVWEDKIVFAHAQLVEIHHKTLDTLIEADWEGHEKFLSDAEMYKKFGGYYNRVVDGSSPIKIITFEIITFL